MTLARMRSALAAILLLGLLGSAAELLLLEHYKDKAQLIPFAAIGATLAALGWHRRAPGPRSQRSLQLALSLLLVAGLLGIVLHVRGNAEFQRELDPSLSGLSLWWKTLRAKAPPALAPGVLAQLALLGLVYASRASGADSRS